MVTKKAKNIAYCFVIAILSAVFMFGSTACGCTPDFSDAPEFKTKVIADFKDGELPDVFFASDGWNNGGSFNVEWDASAVSYSDGAANLSVLEKPDGEEGSVPEVPYYGGELRSQKWYHYGFYSAKMKPSAVEGTCTSFFVYTGPSELGADGEANPWDEVDIEFLGKNTREVQFNFFANGSTGNEYVYKLDFDASKEYHEYGFYWEKDRITWYVDGKPVYRVTSEEKTLPSTPGRIMMNHWSGNAEGEGWMGKYTADTSTSSYKTVSCTADPMDPYVEPETPPEEGEYELTEGEDEALTFVNAGSAYSINNGGDNKSYNVSYSEINAASYGENIFDATNISALSREKNAFGITVKNNGTETVNVKIDVMDTDIECDYSGQTPGLPNHQCINAVAYKNGISAVTDLQWGGSKFEIEAGKTDRLLVIFDGNPDKIALFFDSHMASGGPFSGNVEISEFRFGVATGEGIPEPAEPGEEPETPTYDPSVFDGVEPTSVEFNIVPEVYTVKQNEEKTDLRVVYSEVMGNSYQNVASDITLSGKSAFSVKMTNNGDKDVNIRINLVAYGDAGTINANDYATYNGTAVNTDKTWGGSFFTVPAGETGTAIVWFTSPMTQVQFMIDSHIGDETTRSGDVTFSEFKFA